MLHCADIIDQIGDRRMKVKRRLAHAPAFKTTARPCTARKTKRL
jgi:hypothetical protein